MNEVDINYLIKTYGYQTLTIAWAIRELFPFFRDRFFPEFLNQRKQENERRWQRDERQVKADEIIAEGVQGIKVFLATLDARSDVTAQTVQRIEVSVTEINVRSRAQSREPVTLPVGENGKKARRL